MAVRWEGPEGPKEKKLTPDKYGTVALGDVPAGHRVRVEPCDLEATVISQGRAFTTVDIHRVREREFTTSTGTKVKISKSTDRATWSPGTRVEVVD